MHVWTAPAGDDQRSAAKELLLELAGSLLERTAVLRHEPSGRPYVDGLAVSLSHSRSLVAVAASATGPVGVDVEDVYPRDVSGLARRWFDPSELEWMAGEADELTAFLQLWTAKEAVGKALGLGLRNTGLRRRMPLPAPVQPEHARRGLALPAGLVSSEPSLTVLHLPVDQQAVLAVALPAAATEVLLTEHHGAALRRTVRSRTSFPVVVRGI
ncbi:4'-phosphopantetheinyl transferase superfamily protein [Kribbella steppae]|uniref:4'-phosphopantetheinyl transferase superfamily protein n=1 Tax=Kribbella steppae TaxID=2512223 RepID=A0A4R2GSC2_9ACTN|nr:4'-phosphopantetheinyl transferase superfamily protein [Kribbella steppae]